jgi:hypothetical protein
LNKKYSLDHLSGAIKQVQGERSEQVDNLKRQLVEKAQVLFISFQQISSPLIERNTTVKWDTVIIDDASLISESEILQILKHGA